MSTSRVLLLADTRGWAWHRKSEQIALHLGDEFAMEIAFHVDGAPPAGFDLYHTFEMPQVQYVPPGSRYVTGITAHVLGTWGPRQVRAWLSGANAVHANSKLLQAELQEIIGAGADVHYLPNGVDHRFWRRVRPRKERTRLVVGHVGKPNPRKGAQIIEEACAAVGCELRMIRRRAANALPPEDLLEWYQDIDVLVVASDMDGTPNPALEAAACEVAVVSNRIGNMPEFIIDGENGHLVERTAPDIARCLAGLAKDLRRVEHMGRAARRTVLAGWTWQQQSQRVRELWRAVLGGAS